MANEVTIHVKAEGRGVDREMDVIGRKAEVSAKRSFLKTGGHAGAAFAAGFIKTITLGQVGSGFAMAATKMAPQMAHLGGALGVTLAGALVVKLASAVSALLPAALGGGMLAGPLIYLWKTQEKAVDRLKKRVKEFMGVISEPVKVPFLKSLEMIGDQLGKWGPKVKDAFKSLGPALKPLTKGALGAVGDFFKEIGKKLPSITAALEEWGKKLPKIGKALGRMLGNWIGDVDETKASVDDLADSIVTIADAVGAVGKGFRKFGKMNDSFKNMMDEQRAMILKWRIAMLKSLIVVADAWGQLSPQGRKVAASLRKSLGESQKDLSKTNNRINDVKDSLSKGNWKAQIKADKRDLEAKYRESKNRLEWLKRQKPTPHVRAEIRQAMAAMRRAKYALQQLDGYTARVHIKTIYSGINKRNAGAPFHASGGNIGSQGAASGGNRGGAQTWVGESGPELVDLPYGSHVNSNADSMRKAGQGGGKGGEVHFHFHGPVYGDHNALKRALVNMKRSGDLDLVLR